MIIVIDGYNVLKQISLGHQVSEQERRQFIHMLSTYRRRKKHSIVLVFDGGPDTWPSKETIANIQVMYSGSRKNADTVIMEYLKGHSTKDLLLVSSDNELCHFANKYDIVSIGSQEFHSIMQEALAMDDDNFAQQEPEIEIDETEHDLNALMEAGSQVVPQKDEDKPAFGKTQESLQRSSKRDRALLKKLNKL